MKIKIYNIDKDQMVFNAGSILMSNGTHEINISVWSYNGGPIRVCCLKIPKGTYPDPRLGCSSFPAELAEKIGKLFQKVHLYFPPELIPLEGV